MAIELEWFLDEDPDSPGRQEIERQKQALESPAKSNNIERDIAGFSVDSKFIELFKSLTWDTVKDTIHNSRFTGNPESQAMLEQLAEDVASAAFPEIDPGTELIPPGERPAAARRFLDFLCAKCFLPADTTVYSLNALFGTESLLNRIPRNDEMEKAIFGENRLRVWIEENESNRFEFWKAVMPEKPLPDCVPGVAEFNARIFGVILPANEKQEKSESKKRAALRCICGKKIANDIGNWDGVRKSRYFNFLPETDTWLRDKENVKKLLPTDGHRHGEKFVNNHLSTNYGFTLGRSTLEKYEFIKSKKHG